MHLFICVGLCIFVCVCLCMYFRTAYFSKRSLCLFVCMLMGQLPCIYMWGVVAVISSVNSVPRVAGSNPTLAATAGPWASPSFRVERSALACKLRHNINAVVGSASEKLML